MKIFVVVPLHFFGSASTIIRFGERFLDRQYSLVSFLFVVWYVVLLLTVPPCPAICKSGGTYPPVPLELVQLVTVVSANSGRLKSQDWKLMD